MRRRVDARFIALGNKPVTREETVFARQRQVNSCDLADAVKLAFAPKKPEAAPDAGAPDAAEADADGAPADAGAAAQSDAGVAPPAPEQKD